MLMRCRTLCCERWSLSICSSVFLVLRCCGTVIGVNVMSLCMYVMRPPPGLCVLSVRYGV